MLNKSNAEANLTAPNPTSKANQARDSNSGKSSATSALMYHQVDEDSDLSKVKLRNDTKAVDDIPEVDSDDTLEYEKAIMNDIQHAESSSLIVDSFKASAQEALDDDDATSDYEDNDRTLQISISNPEKHSGEGALKDTYVSYQIEFRTVLEHFDHRESRLRRRYKDFLWLHARLGKEYENCILPPLPEKHLLNYWDRFEEDFIQKRMKSLNRYCSRLSTHPILKKSESLRVFLEVENTLYSGSSSPSFQPSSLDESYGKPSSSLLGAVSEGIYSAINKISDKLNTRSFELKHLTQFQRMYMSIKSDTQILKNLYSMHQKAHASYNETLNNFKTRVPEFYKMLSNNNGEMKEILSYLDYIGARNTFLESKLKYEESNFLCILREMILYTQNAKALLKLRSQKEYELEQLRVLLGSLLAEKENLSNLDNGAKKLGIKEYLGKKIDSIRGFDSLAARQERLDLIEGQMQQTKDSIDSSERFLKAFNHSVLKEVKYFRRVRNDELKKALIQDMESDREYHQSVLDHHEKP